MTELCSTLLLQTSQRLALRITLTSLFPAARVSHSENKAGIFTAIYRALSLSLSLRCSLHRERRTSRLQAWFEFSHRVERAISHESERERESGILKRRAIDSRPQESLGRDTASHPGETNRSYATCRRSFNRADLSAGVPCPVTRAWKRRREVTSFPWVDLG